MRKVMGNLLGVIVAMLVITGVEGIGHAIDPPPVMADTAAFAAYAARLSAGMLALIVFGYFLGALVGGWVATYVGRWRYAAWIVAVVIAIAGVANMLLVPQPLWMQVGTVLAPLVGGWVALHLGARRVGIAG